MNKECFGNYTYCSSKDECTVKDECLKSMIEKIRKNHLGEELANKLKEKNVSEREL